MLNDQEKEQEQLKLVQVTGKPQHIEINERTLQVYKEEIAKKSLL